MPGSFFVFFCRIADGKYFGDGLTAKPGTSVPVKKEENRDWKWRGPRAMINASNQKEKTGFLSISGGRKFAVR